MDRQSAIGGTRIVWPPSCPRADTQWHSSKFSMFFFFACVRPATWQSCESSAITSRPRLWIPLERARGWGLRQRRLARYPSLRLGVGRDICAGITHTAFSCLLGVSRNGMREVAAPPWRDSVTGQKSWANSSPRPVDRAQSDAGVAGFPGCGTQAGMLGTRRGNQSCRSMCIAHSAGLSPLRNASCAASSKKHCSAFYREKLHAFL